MIKKHSIGHNTVTSVDGIISTRGVKSKPNDIRIFGYTHEIGNGEKSPDNPYQLVSLDSGNVNLYDANNITGIQVTNDGILRKGIIIESSYFKSKKCCIYFDLNESTGISKTSVGINIKFLYKNGQYEVFKEANFINSPKRIEIADTVEKILIYEAESGANGRYFDLYKNLTILDSPILPTETITEEHSITLTNNNTTIKIPVPIALNSVENINDKIVKKNNEYYIEQNINDIVVNEESSIMVRAQQNGYTKFNINITNGRIVNTNKIICNKMLVSAQTLLDAFQYEYIRSSISKYPDLLVAYILTNRVTSNTTATKQEICSYLQNNNIRILYQVNIPQYWKLSDYAQELLNSFVLENKNNISVEGNPDIEISGYLKKGAT